MKPSKWLYVRTRDLHLYAGLFICPFLLIFAVSTVYLNHRWEHSPPAQGTFSEPVKIDVPTEGNQLQKATEVQHQLGIGGEPGGMQTRKETQELIFNYSSPGFRNRVHVDTQTGLARVEIRKSGLADALIFLHMMPGPHKPEAISPGMRAWSWVADSVVYLLLFLTASGIYLWWVLKAERKLGLIMLGGGASSFLLIMTGLFKG